MIPKAFGLPNIGKTLYHRWYKSIRICVKTYVYIRVSLSEYTCSPSRIYVLNVASFIGSSQKKGVFDVDIRKKSYLCRKELKKR